MKKSLIVGIVVAVGIAIPNFALGAHIYQVGDTWLHSTDWTAQTNPDDDSYGTAGVWTYGGDSGDLTNITILDQWAEGSYPNWSSSVDGQCQVTQSYQHPGISLSSDRIWTSPITGSVQITGSASTPWGSNDGAYAKIYLLEAATSNVTLLQESTLLTTGNGFSFDVGTSVAAGDKVIFQVSRNGNNWTDHTFWDPQITALTVPEPATLAMISFGGALALIKRRK